MRVNGIEAHGGCYIDGHWGQYGNDMLADVCDQFEIVLLPNDRPATWREIAENSDDDQEIDNAWTYWSDQADTLVDELNNRTEGGHWSWEDGEFFLTQTEIESTLYVLGDDYDQAWQRLLNNHTRGYSAPPLEPGRSNVHKFPITIHYDPEEA